MKKVIIAILYITAIFSAIALAGVPDVAEWWEMSKPFYIIFAVSLALAMGLTFPNKVRRITYPILVCVCAWAYKHKVVTNSFAMKTYRVYKLNNSSYYDLFGYTQGLFDKMYA